MKKVESVLDGSLGWGKTRTFATFPQILFSIRCQAKFSTSLPNAGVMREKGHSLQIGSLTSNLHDFFVVSS